MRSIIVYIVVVTSGMIRSGADNAGISKPARTALEALKWQHEVLRSELSSPLTELKRRYSGELNALRERAVKLGDLDFTLEIEQEMEALSGGRPSAASPRRELARIQMIYAKEREKLTIQREQKLEELVVAQLEKLRILEKALTTKDQIGAALEVRAELQRMEGLREVLGSSNAELLTSRQWVRHDVKLGKQRIFEFDEGGGMRSVGVKSSWRKWKSTGRTVSMFLANGAEYEFVILREERPIVIEGVVTGRGEFFFVESER